MNAMTSAAGMRGRRYLGGIVLPWGQAGEEMRSRCAQEAVRALPFARTRVLITSDDAGPQALAWPKPPAKTCRWVHFWKERGHERVPRGRLMGRQSCRGGREVRRGMSYDVTARSRARADGRSGPLSSIPPGRLGGADGSLQIKIRASPPSRLPHPHPPPATAHARRLLSSHARRNDERALVSCRAFSSAPLRHRLLTSVFLAAIQVRDQAGTHSQVRR